MARMYRVVDDVFVEKRAGQTSASIDMVNNTYSGNTAPSGGTIASNGDTSIMTSVIMGVNSSTSDLYVLGTAKA